MSPTPLPGKRRAFRFVNGALVAPTTPLTTVTPVITTPTAPTGTLSDILLVGIDTSKANITLPSKPHFQVQLSSKSNNYDGITVDIEAWQNGVKVYQSYVTGKTIRVAQTTYVELDMDVPVAGTYQLQLMLFNDPQPGSYAFGAKIYEALNVKNFTITAAPVYVPPTTTTDTTEYYKAPQQVNNYVAAYPSMKVIADQPQGTWFGNDWIPDVKKAAQDIAAAAAGKRILLVTYSIPNRDNGNYSAGGLHSPQAYKDWIDQLALGMGTAKVDYIVEPDALALSTDLSTQNKADRIDMLRYAVAKLKSNVNARVYLDMGSWKDPQTAADLLHQCDPGNLNGVSLNVSGYKYTQTMVDYANAIRQYQPSLHYVIDTSRNGKGPNGDEWCNPRDRGLGQKPVQNPSGLTGCDALLWIKAPGESDGTCNGGPNAGAFWVDKALELITNANFNTPSSATAPSKIPSAAVQRATFLAYCPNTGSKYYVAKNGSDSAAGTTSAPFATIQKAISVAVAGDQILVRPGDYGYVRFDGKMSATAGKWLTILPENLGDLVRVHIDPANTGTYENLTVYNSSWIGIFGLEVYGDQINDANEKRSGIAVYGGSHHIRIWGNHVHDVPGGGINCFQIDTGSYDMLDISYNQIHGTSRRSPDNTSGISIYAPKDITNGDSWSTGHGIQIVGNNIYDVVCTVPYTPGGFTFVTDGNGISLDLIYDTNNYTKGILVQDNLIHGCGARGMHAYGTINVDALHNIGWGNMRTDSPAINGDMEFDSEAGSKAQTTAQAQSVLIYGNVIYPTHTPNWGDARSMYSNNVIVGGTQAVTGTNLDRKSKGSSYLPGFSQDANGYVDPAQFTPIPESIPDHPRIRPRV